MSFESGMQMELDRAKQKGKELVHKGEEVATQADHRAEEMAQQGVHDAEEAAHSAERKLSGE